MNDGTNTLEIDVTNLWVNRLIGDERYPDLVKRTGWRNNPAIGRLTEIPEWLDSGQPLPNDTERQTFVAFQHWGNDSDLAPSGLIGSAKLTLEKDHR